MYPLNFRGKNPLFRICFNSHFWKHFHTIATCKKTHIILLSINWRGCKRNYEFSVKLYFLRTSTSLCELGSCVWSDALISWGIFSVDALGLPSATFDVIKQLQWPHQCCTCIMTHCLSPPDCLRFIIHAVSNRKPASGPVRHPERWKWGEGIVFNK